MVKAGQRAMPACRFSHREKPESPFCCVYLDFPNVSDVAGQMKLRLAPDRLALAVADKSGKELAVANGPYDGMSPSRESGAESKRTMSANTAPARKSRLRRHYGHQSCSKNSTSGETVVRSASAERRQPVPSCLLC